LFDFNPLSQKIFIFSPYTILNGTWVFAIIKFCKLFNPFITLMIVFILIYRYTNYMRISRRHKMNNITNFNQTKVPTPPAFMATTRQKIYLMQHHLPVQDDMYIRHPKTMNVLHSIGNVVKDFIQNIKSA